MIDADTFHGKSPGAVIGPNSSVNWSTSAPLTFQNWPSVVPSSIVRDLSVSAVSSAA